MESTTCPSPIGASILIVDDEQVPRHSLATFLRHANYQAVEASSGQEALECIGRQHFDLVLLDLKMPEMDGIQVLQAALPIAPDTVFIILTAYGTLDSAIATLRHGAFDYLLKPSSMPEIVRAIEAGLAEQRRRLVPNAPMALLEQALDILRTMPQAMAKAPDPERFLQAREITVDTVQRIAVMRGQPVDLTATEFDILTYLLRHQEQVVSCRQLVAHLRGCDLDERDARIVVRAQVNRLRHKLEPGSSRPRLIHTVRGMGYRFAS